MKTGGIAWFKIGGVMTYLSDTQSIIYLLLVAGYSCEMVSHIMGHWPVSPFSWRNLVLAVRAIRFTTLFAFAGGLSIIAGYGLMASDKASKMVDYKTEVSVGERKKVAEHSDRKDDLSPNPKMATSAR